MAKEIEFKGLRHDGLGTLFQISPLRTEEGTKHMPLIVMRSDGSQVKIIRNLDLLKQKQNDWVFCVWQGRRRSDVFRFQVRDFREHIKNNPRQADQVI